MGGLSVDTSEALDDDRNGKDKAAEQSINDPFMDSGSSQSPLTDGSSTKLLFPVNMNISESGEFEVVEIDLSTMKNPQLLDLIRRWNLKPNMRNRASYIQSLQDFSADRRVWTTERMVAIRKHKGPRNMGTTAGAPTRKYVKSSALRREQLMNRANDSQISCQTADLRSKDMRTHAQLAELSKWADGVLNMPDLQAPSLTSYSPPAPSYLIAELSRCTRELSLQLSSIRNQGLIPATPGSCDRYASSRQLQTTVVSQNVETDVLAMQLPSVPVQQYFESDSNVAPTLNTGAYSLQLARRTITYSAAEIPDPPAISFVRDLARLDRMWDDGSSQWDDSSPLRIQGHSIAIIYWPKVYRYQRTKQWTGIKQRWFEWKTLIAEYQALGPSSFWIRYSAGGSPLPISKILHEMKAARLQEDCSIVGLAKAQYGDNFGQVFSYRIAGQTEHRRLVRPHAIARRYRMLNGLMPNVPIAQDQLLENP